MGYPVALEASAEERDTRGFTSMTAYSKLFGFSANWQLQPPSMPSESMISRVAERSIWYSRSASVTAGAMTMLSPVWTPTGSKFSMLQIVITFPFASRMPSNSISFQPETQRSTRICVIGERRRPFNEISASSSRVCAMPPPEPPSVNAGRTMTG